MIRTLQLPKHITARVWTGELPSVGFAAKDTLQRTHPAQERAVSAPKAVGAVEVLRSPGKPSGYGLVGGELTLLPNSEFRVKVNASMRDGRAYAESLAPNSDNVHVGLPAEYVNGIFEGVELAIANTASVWAGELFVNRAVYSDVGSSLAMFKYLSLILLKLLYLEDPSPSDAILLKLFPKQFVDFGRETH